MQARAVAGRTAVHDISVHVEMSLFGRFHVRTTSGRTGM